MSSSEAVNIVIPVDSIADRVVEKLAARHSDPRTDRRTADAHRDDLPGEPKEWLTNAEAQAYLGLSRMTLQRYRDNGLLEFSKVGSNIFYRRRDILALLEKNAQLSVK